LNCDSPLVLAGLKSRRKTKNKCSNQPNQPPNLCKTQLLSIFFPSWIFQDDDDKNEEEKAEKAERGKQCFEALVVVIVFDVKNKEQRKIVERYIWKKHIEK